MTRHIFAIVSEELRACVDAARGSSPLGPWLERLLARQPEVVDAAKKLRVQIPERAVEGRGHWRRAKIAIKKKAR